MRSNMSTTPLHDFEAATDCSVKLCVAMDGCFCVNPVCLIAGSCSYRNGLNVLYSLDDIVGLTEGMILCKCLCTCIAHVAPK